MGPVLKGTHALAIDLQRRAFLGWYPCRHILQYRFCH